MTNLIISITEIVEKMEKIREKITNNRDNKNFF
mgnify:CR=1 FL=1